MTKFELYSELQRARLRVTRNDGDETIHVERPFYRDVLEVDWNTTHYKIVREGIVVREARVYKENDYIGKIDEQIGFLTHFNVYMKAKRVFEIAERETLLEQYFEIKKNGKVIGKIKPVGVYIPILSNIYKGIEGEYTQLSKEEEEILLMTILAIGV